MGQARYTVSMHQTEWGYLAAAWSEQGLWELTFPQADYNQAVAELTVSGSVASGAWVDELDLQLRGYFQQECCNFTVMLDWSGYTAFQRAILQFTATIGYGEVRTYAQTAAAVGSPRAFRAAGGALHINRTPIVVPCHRVIGTSGKLVGFGGGIDRKAALLALEQTTHRVSEEQL